MSWGVLVPLLSAAGAWVSTCALWPPASPSTRGDVCGGSPGILPFHPPELGLALLTCCLCPQGVLKGRRGGRNWLGRLLVPRMETRPGGGGRGPQRGLKGTDRNKETREGQGGRGHSLHRGEKGKEAGICAALLRVRENTHSLRQPGRHPGGGDNPEGSGDTPQVTQLGGLKSLNPGLHWPLRRDPSHRGCGCLSRGQSRLTRAVNGEHTPGCKS